MTDTTLSICRMKLGMNETVPGVGAVLEKLDRACRRKVADETEVRRLLRDGWVLVERFAREQMKDMERLF